MKANIEVADRKEAEAIRAGLADPVVRASVIIMGVLSTLPSHRAKIRVMAYVNDLFAEQKESTDGKPITGS